MTPLIPLPLLVILIVATLAALWICARPRVRRQWPRLLPEAGILAILSGLHLLFFWQPYRSGAQVPAGGGDLVSFFHPIHAFAAREIQAGRIPFWSPHQYSGMPHLANFQTGALYPPNLVAYLLSEPFSYATLERLALLHFLLASYGGYWLARSLGLGRLVATTSGVIFAYSGFMAAHLGHYPLLVTAAWAPFVYAALIATIRRASWTPALGGTLALAMAILGGHQPMLLLVLSGAGLLALFELWRLSGYTHPAAWRDVYHASPVRHAGLRCGFMLVVAFGLALPAVGPAAELAGHASRGELSYREASEFSVEPLALIHMVLPTAFGSNPTDFWGPFSNTEIWGYAGIATLILAGFGLVAGTRRTRLFWGALLLLGLLYAVGPYSPFHGWLYAFVPVYDHVRGAGRGYFFVDLALALLAGFGLQVLLRQRSEPSPRVAGLLRLAERGALIALGTLVLFVIPLFTSLVLGVNDPTNRPMIALDNLIMLALWLGLTLAVIAFYRRSRASGQLAVLLLSSVIVIDLFSVTARFNPTTDPILTGFDHPELVAFLDEQRETQGPIRVDNRSTALQPDAARLHGFDAVGGLVDPLALERYEQYRNRPPNDATTLQELNARYVITDAAAEGPPEPGATVALTTARLIVWELPESRSRAWYVDDPGRAVEVTAARPGRVEIATASDSPGGTLVVSQVDYPGWEATLDGEALPIEQYQGTLQAVTVPAGEHRIVLQFEQRYWTFWVAGAALSGLVLVAACALTAVPGLRRRRRARAA